MYIKFKKDVYHPGKVYKEDGVYYISNAKRAQSYIDDGSAEVIDYEEHHKTIKDKVIQPVKDGK